MEGYCFKAKLLRRAKVYLEDFVGIVVDKSYKTVEVLL